MNSSDFHVIATDPNHRRFMNIFHFFVRVSVLLLGLVAASADSIIGFQNAADSVDEGAGRVDLVVLRGGDMSETVTAEYHTEDDTATAGHDYIPVHGTVSFAPGQDKAILSIIILDDYLLDGNEAFRVVLSKLSPGVVLGGQIAWPQITVTIADNERAACADGSFDPGLGPNGTITDIQIQPDGRILLAGRFSTYNGVRRPGIARIFPDGRLDESFHPDGRFKFNTESPAMVLLADGRILALKQA
jgi:hypothetical protein